MANKTIKQLNSNQKNPSLNDYLVLQQQDTNNNAGGATYSKQLQYIISQNQILSKIADTEFSKNGEDTSQSILNRIETVKNSLSSSVNSLSSSVNSLNSSVNSLSNSVNNIGTVITMTTSTITTEQTIPNSGKLNIGSINLSDGVWLVTAKAEFLSPGSSTTDPNGFNGEGYSGLWIGSQAGPSSPEASQNNPNLYSYSRVNVTNMIGRAALCLENTALITLNSSTTIYENVAIISGHENKQGRIIPSHCSMAAVKIK